jgi:HTH-type transcriptional regulator/antitoxin HigA
MIRNERQLKISSKRLGEILEAANQASPEDRAVWDRLATDVRCEISEYLAIKNGETVTFEINSLDDLPDAITKARIAKGITQGELAELLEVSEQMVQKNESGGYENAGLVRLADACDVLGYQLVGRLQPAGQSSLTVSTVTPTVVGMSGTAATFFSFASNQPQHHFALGWPQAGVVSYSGTSIIRGVESQ